MKRSRVFAALVSAASLLSLAPARAELVERIAGVVNGQPIPYSDVMDRAALELSRLAAITDPAEREKQRQAILKRSLDVLVDERLIETEAAAFQLEVSEEEQNKSVEMLAKQNNLTSEQFKEELTKQKIDFAQVKDSLRRQALRFKLLQAKVKPRKITDEEIKSAYAAMNATPEYEVRARHLYVRVPPSPSPKQLEAAKLKIDRATARLDAGEEFAVVARDLSDGPTASTGGDLGFFKRGMFLPELEAAAFRLKPGEHSQAFKLPGGYHMVKVEDRRPLPPKPLSEVQDQLRNQIAQDGMLKEQDRYLAQLRKGAQVELRM